MQRDMPAERAVLADIYQRGQEAWLDLSEIQLSSDTFSEENGKLYSAFTHALKTTTKLDLPTVQSAAQTLKIPFERDQWDYLRGLQNFPLETTNVVGLAKKIKKLEIARLLDQQVQIIRRDLSKVTGDETTDEIIGIAEKQVMNFSALLGDGNGTHQIAEGIDEFFTNLKNNPDCSVGIPTGWRHYDASIGGGIRLGTVNLIGARTGVGKSFLTINAAINIARQGIPVLVIDTEMSKEEQWPRILASMSGVDIDKIESGKLFKNEIDCQKVTKARKELATLPIQYRVVKNMRFDEIIAVIKRWIHKELDVVDGIAKPAVVIYDYFKVMNTDDLKSQDEFRALGFQLSRFSDLMGKYKVGSLAFTQLNRDGVDKEDLTAISQSDRLTWFCPSVAIFKEKGMGDDTQYSHKLIPLKCRHGQKYKDGQYINMNFNGRIGKITEGPPSNAIKPGNDSRAF